MPYAAPAMDRPPHPRRGVRRTVLVLALIAIAVYVAFILSGAQLT